MAKWKEGVKIFLFGAPVPCLYCQCETDEPLIVKVRHENKKVEQHFCGELCASIYWMERLREAGL